MQIAQKNYFTVNRPGRPQIDAKQEILDVSRSSDILHFLFNVLFSAKNYDTYLKEMLHDDFVTETERLLRSLLFIF